MMLVRVCSGERRSHLKFESRTQPRFKAMQSAEKKQGPSGSVPPEALFEDLGI